MDAGIPQEVTKTLHLSASVVAVVAVIATGFFIYRTLLETKLTKLKIEQLEAEKLLPPTELALSNTLTS